MKRKQKIAAYLVTREGKGLGIIHAVNPSTAAEFLALKSVQFDKLTAGTELNDEERAQWCAISGWGLGEDWKAY